MPPGTRLSTQSIDLAEVPGVGKSGRTVTHSVRAEVDLPFVFYSAGQIRRVELLGLSEVVSGGGARGAVLPAGLAVDRNGCIYAPGRVMRRGTRYQVVSIPMEQPVARPSAAIPVGDADLGTGRPSRESRVSASDDLALGISGADPEEIEAYMRVPLRARRVADLARRVVGDARDPSEKLAALVSYLQRNYVYSSEAPAVPWGEDAADYFLFRQKRGQCDLFATALALMARAVGIPTRLATGFAGGVYDEQRGRWVIREADAHAWVEAYVEPWGGTRQAGWVSVDATAAGEAAPVPPVRRALLSARFLLQDRSIAIAIGISAAAAGLLFALFWRRRGLDRALKRQARADPRAAVLWAYVQLCHFLRRRGRPRQPSQTPLEFLAALEAGASPAQPLREGEAQRAGAPVPISSRAGIRQVRRTSPAGLAAVRDLTGVFLLARYGPGPVSEETAQLAARKLVEVRRAWRMREERRGSGS